MSMISLPPASRMLYERLLGKYEDSHDEIEQASSDTAEYAKQWARKVELLSMPEIARTVTAKRLAEYKSEVRSQLKRMESARAKAFALDRELNQGVSYFRKRTLTLIGEREMFALIDLQEKKEKIASLHDSIAKSLPAARGQGQKILEAEALAPLSKGTAQTILPSEGLESAGVAKRQNFDDVDSSETALPTDLETDPDLQGWEMIEAPVK